MNKPRTRVSTRQRTATETRVQQAQMTDLEEQVVRMRYGLALQPEAELEQRQLHTEEARAQVLAIEEQAVARLLNTKDMRRKQAIIAQLRKL